MCGGNEVDVVRQRRRQNQSRRPLALDDRREHSNAVFVLRIDSPGDKIEAQRRAASQSAELKSGIVVAVWLERRTVGVDQHDLPGHSARKCPRLLVHRIAKSLDRASNAFARFGPNIASVVEHPRHGDARDTGSPRDVVDGGVVLHARAGWQSFWRRATVAERACQMHITVPNYTDGSASINRAIGTVSACAVCHLPACEQYRCGCPSCAHSNAVIH